jgi:hypothetical protein
MQQDEEDNLYPLTISNLTLILAGLSLMKLSRLQQSAPLSPTQQVPFSTLRQGSVYSRLHADWRWWGRLGWSGP